MMNKTSKNAAVALLIETYPHLFLRKRGTHSCGSPAGLVMRSESEDSGRNAQNVAGPYQAERHLRSVFLSAFSKRRAMIMHATLTAKTIQQIMTA